MNNSLLPLLPATPDKEGWPWTIETDPAVYHQKAAWPKISIVIPSYNQGHFIEETLRSILLQNYPDLELIVMDGGSTDQTINVLNKYKPWINRMISEKDRGQADAINKGLAFCTGQIFNWINSDDLLAPEALAEVAALYKNGASVAGAVLNFYDDDPAFSDVVTNSDLNAGSFLSMRSVFHQPGVWADLESFRKAGSLPLQSSYYFDRIFFSRYFLLSPEVVYTSKVLVHFRYHSSSKTVTEGLKKADELLRFYHQFLSDEAFKTYRGAIEKTIRYKLNTEERVCRWQQSSEGRPAILRLLSYLYISVSYPRVLLTRYYFTKLKKHLLQ